MAEMIFNPLLQESLKRIEEFGSSQPRGPGQRNLGMDFLTNNAMTSLLPTTQETNENVASLIGERRSYGRGQGTPLNLGILDMGRGVDRRFRPRADVAPVVADSSAQSDAALLPSVGASQTASTPTNMQASNMSLQEIGKAFAEDEKDFEKDIDDEIELKKQTKFGDAMARIGGGITLSEEQRKALSPTAREKYNQERLSARNKGIAEMLFVLSDALAGRDVIGRSMERQQARLPKEKSASKIRDELIRKIQSGAKLSADELVTLKVIDPTLAEQLLLDPELSKILQPNINSSPASQSNAEMEVTQRPKKVGNLPTGEAVVEMPDGSLRVLTS